MSAANSPLELQATTERIGVVLSPPSPGGKVKKLHALGRPLAYRGRAEHLDDLIMGLSSWTRVIVHG